MVGSRDVVPLHRLQSCLEHLSGMAVVDDKSSCGRCLLPPEGQSKLGRAGPLWEDIMGAVERAK